MIFGAPGIIERAFQLARCSESVDHIRVKLRQEGYSSVEAHLAGRKIRYDLNALIKQSV